MKFHILPHVFLEMEEQEKAFVAAAIEIKCKNDKKESRRLEGLKR